MTIQPTRGIRGWLDTNGVCYHVKDTHTDFSAKALNIKLLPQGTPEFLKAGFVADKRMYDKGWVRIVLTPESRTLYFDTLNVPWKNLTRYQRGWLFDTATNGITIEGGKLVPTGEVLKEPLTFIFGDTGKNPRPDELITESTSFFGMLKQVLTERMSFRDLYNASDSGRKHRAAHVRPRPLKVATMNKKETWTFRYKSYPSTTGNPWHGYIQFFKDSAVHANSAGDVDCIVDCDCFSGDVPVLMKDGTYKPIKDITVGDEIYTHRGRVKRVTNTMYRNVRSNESTYKIKVSGFPGEMIVTENHPFYTLRGNDYCLCGCNEKIWESSYSNQCSSPTLVLSRKYVRGHHLRYKVKNDNSCGSFEWVQIKDLRDHEWFLTPWLEEEKNEFDDTNFARLIGYYIAEGCIPNERGTEVRLTFNINEWDTLGNDVVKICNKLGYKTRLYKHKTRKCFDVRIQNKSFREFCKYNVGMGSFNKRISYYIMSWNNECLKNVFIGATLGDGWIDPLKGVKYFSISFNLVSQISTILNRLQIRNSISILNKHTDDVTRHPVYQVIIPRGNSANKVKLWMWPYLREKDKFELSMVNLHSVGHHRQEGQIRPIMNCEKTDYSGLVYDITVEDDASFIANGIAVHNCPDYRYKWAYANTQQDASRIGRRSWNQCINKPPNKTNPNQTPGLCKHLISLGEYLKTKLDPTAPEPEDDDKYDPYRIKPKIKKEPVPASTLGATVQAPEPNDSYSDSRAGSDTLQEDIMGNRRSELYDRIEQFVSETPEFEVMYDDAETSNNLNEDYHHYHKDYRMYEGNTHIKAMFEDGSDLEFEVHYHDNRGDDKTKHRAKAMSKWKSLASKIHNDVELNEVGNPIQLSWKESFQLALISPDMKEFIRTEDHHRVFPR